MRMSRFLVIFILAAFLASVINLPVAQASGYSPPTGVKVSILGSSSAKMSWTAQDPGETAYYDIYLGTSPSSLYPLEILENSQHSYIFRHLLANTTYYFAVGACPFNGDNSSKPSTPIAKKTKAGIGAPSGVKATSVSSSQIKITWNAKTGATKYAIYDCYSANGSYHFLGYVSGTSYTEKNLNANKQIFYIVRAVNSTGEGITSATVNAWTRTAAPTNLKAKAASTTGIKLTWNVTTGAKGYSVYRYNSATQTYKMIGHTPASASPSYTDSGLKAGTKYAYKVTAVNTGGESAKSGIAAAITLLPNP